MTTTQTELIESDIQSLADGGELLGAHTRQASVDLGPFRGSRPARLRRERDQTNLGGRSERSPQRPSSMSLRSAGGDEGTLGPTKEPIVEATIAAWQAMVQQPACLVGEPVGQEFSL